METDNITRKEERNFLDKSLARTTFSPAGITTRELIFLLALVFCISPLISPPLALLIGLVIAQFIGHPYMHLNHKVSHILLQISVVGLGFRMNVSTALQAGKEGMLITIASIAGTLVIGYLIGFVFKTNNKTSYLIAAGTAICGGSAIAAISPVIKAEEKQISVALGTTFILNAIALVLFPIIGYKFQLSQTQFGLWCAIAIHDTSSVVGAAGKYGNEALEVAATIKLARALWIVPVAFFSTLIFKNKGATIKIPYFIGLFVVAICLNTYVPAIQQYHNHIVGISKSVLTVTLFLIGCGLSGKTVRSVGLKPILQGLILWLIISYATLLTILYW
ncbi:putative sulfate exporter family transporter [Niastella caeni]|uniref:Putative sulfate exporter family transporter n=1 Tax=Niastella caeni TaxID=2569763 RepID=A0A4S8HUD2_9BACT|nr:putative sulfate exporter family transporter [Niastella caeni]THU39160.1 putative sulfate exporter family transporter [Niastella caeni]